MGKKLGLATAFMFTLPVATFFAAQWVFRYKQQPDNWAGAAAILMVNLIVGTYCYVAYVEDSELEKNKQHDNDANQPRVGIFKRRVDWDLILTDWSIIPYLRLERQCFELLLWWWCGTLERQNKKQFRPSAPLLRRLVDDG